MLSNVREASQRCVIVLLGHPGSGKGTFAQALKDRNITHISLGDYLREQYRQKTDIGIRWKAEVERDGILAIKVVQEVTDQLLLSISQGPPRTYILDGHVRLLEQAEHLDELLSKYKNISPFFVYINADKNICLQRIPFRRTCDECHTIYNMKTLPPQREELCDECDKPLTRRDTDNLEMGKNRIDTYASHLEDVVSYYKEKQVLSEYDGNLPIQTCVEQYRQVFE